MPETYFQLWVQERQPLELQNIRPGRLWFLWYEAVKFKTHIYPNQLLNEGYSTFVSQSRFRVYVTEVSTTHCQPCHHKAGSLPQGCHICKVLEGWPCSLYWMTRFALLCNAILKWLSTAGMTKESELQKPDRDTQEILPNTGTLSHWREAFNPEDWSPQQGLPHFSGLWSPAHSRSGLLPAPAFHVWSRFRTQYGTWQWEDDLIPEVRTNSKSTFPCSNEIKSLPPHVLNLQPFSSGQTADERPHHLPFLQFLGFLILIIRLFTHPPVTWFPNLNSSFLIFQIYILSLALCLGS